MKSQTGIGQPARRHHDRALKTRLVDQCLQPGASVAAIAMDNAINANLLFKWRRERRSEIASHLLPTALPTTMYVATPAVLLPVHITPDDDVPQAQAPATLRPVATASVLSTATVAIRPTRPGVIELDIAGAQLRLRGAVDEAILRSVLRALRQSA